MAKHGRSETVKWVAVALLLFNLLVLEATWFRKREDGRQKDFVLKLAHANEACITQRADASRIAKSECPPVECTQADINEFKTQVSKAQAELKVVKTAAESAATSAKQQLKSQSSRIKELEGNSQQQSGNRVLIEKNTEQRYTLSNPQVKTGSVLLLTPAKNAVPQLEQYFSNLKTLTYPRHLTSLGFIVSDSLDYCSREIRKHVKVLDGETYASVIVLQRDYGYAQAPDPDKVPTPDDEVYRRQILARSRNYLLSYALRNQEWVLWLDVDIVYTPPSLVEDLLSHKKMILTTDCIFLDAEGNPTDAHCDGNSWAESDASRKYLKTVDPKKPLFLDYGGDTAFRNTRIRLSAIVGGAKDQPVPLDGVGGSVLLVKADLHREGLIFPSSLVEHQIETEGFAQLCKAIGHQPFGLPDYTVHHAKVTVKPVPVWD